MRVCLYLDPSRVFRWHGWLATTVGAIPGCEVFCALAPESHPLPRSCTLLFELERLIYGLERENAIDRVTTLAQVAPAAAGTDAAEFDVVVDLAGVPTFPLATSRILVPNVNGIPGEIGLIAAVMSRRPLVVQVADTARPKEPWSARPALVDRDIVSRSLNNALSCTASLIAKALNTPESLASHGISHPHSRPHPASASIAVAATLHATGAVAGKAVRLIGLLAQSGKTWAVAWRFDQSFALFNKQRAQFSTMADDGRRYYADPFPFCHNGRRFLFVEEFPYATGRGCISAIELDERGDAVSCRVVLEEAHHLSYPFVFEHDGHIWMIPESGEAKNICLYRAECFPYKWKREAVLMNNISAYDATLLRHDGRFWLFVSEKIWNSSSWDTLSVFHAESLQGSWSAHCQNPILFDATLSRPGGAFFTYNGHKLRPVQDCSRQYGGALVLCRVDTLRRDAFAQTVVGRIHCGPHGCHTYNCSDGLEVIDLFGPRRALKHVTPLFTPLMGHSCAAT